MADFMNTGVWGTAAMGFRMAKAGESKGAGNV
jgi:hypothetical protein